jgi:hypothetical protein
MGANRQELHHRRLVQRDAVCLEQVCLGQCEVLAHAAVDMHAQNLQAGAAIGFPRPAGNAVPAVQVGHDVNRVARLQFRARASLDDLVGKYQAVNIKLDKAGGLTEALAIQVKAGSLAGLLDLLDDEVAQRHDSDGAAEAARLVARINSELAELAAGGPARAASARNVGHELVLGVGMTALTLSLIGTLVM